MANTLKLYRIRAVGFIDWLGGGRAIIPSVKHKNFAVDLSQREIFQAISGLCVASGCAGIFEARNTPILIGNGTSGVGLSFLQRVALNPAVDDMKL